MAAEFDPGGGLGPRLREARTSSELSVRELARRVTGRDLSPDPLMRHLTRKAELYGAK